MLTWKMKIRKKREKKLQDVLRGKRKEENI
jgi:hypothetical protein